MTVVAAFKKHVTSVDRLMNFDRDVLDFAIKNIEELKDRLVQHHKLQNPHLTADRTLEMLKGYRKHDSLRSRYQTIFNQALVLLVSYFGSSVHDLFRQGVASALVHDLDSALLRESVKLTFRELRDADFQLKDIAADLFVQGKDISFQDMQSISRAFKDYLGIAIERDEKVGDIIAAQGCRHVIVHSGGLADERLVRQLSSAKPRQLKVTVVAGEAIEFSVDEVSHAADSMVTYLERIEEEVLAKHSR